MDQIGVVGGPLLVSLVLVASGDYRTAFACLAILSSLMIAALMTAQRLYPCPHDLERASPRLAAQGLHRT